MTALDVEQAGQRDRLRRTTGGEAGDGRHVTGTSVEDQRAGGEAEVVGVSCVEQGRRAATALVAEEVAMCVEGYLGVDDLDACLDHIHQQLLGGNQRNLQIAVRVAVGEQLPDNVVGQRGQQAGIVGRQLSLNEG